MTVRRSLVLYSLACTFEQNDLKRKLEQLTSEASKTRKTFEETLTRVKEDKREADIRQSRETLNKSAKKKRPNKKKAANKKRKTAPKTSEEEDRSLSSEDETTEKRTSKKSASKKATTKKKTASKQAGVIDTSSLPSATKKATTKKKTASKPAGVIYTTSLSSEDDQEEPEGVTIKKHSYDKQKQLYTVWVSWTTSKKSDWQFLHDMWVDYPEEVTYYRDLKRLKASAWQVPNIDGAAFVVRILSMNGPTPLSATFSILFDNGYVEKEASYADIYSDAPDLLAAFLHERE